MKTIIAAIIVNTCILVGLVAVALPVRAAPMPCEDMLKDMRSTKAAAKLGADDKAKVDALEAKAVERCNADDDARSDKFLAEAMKIMGK
ncbi:hypothetical protein [Neorhizobium alkalisoli]|jgi:hypothetical protein|uniref:Uncharacterized protein n=1 Tax=Neorhizobium alkalisoli TaxID=528178 RepID=A0A561R8X2_9HYPH|nr:hypothetical protein [Neorhizobium alkalisoli]TWF59034.1 hypothetical protein FHW37_101838 [Neorhizobium alkalisoli]